MKIRRLFLLFPLAFQVSCSSSDRSYRPKQLDPNVTYDNVYLIMGQSNASGISYYSYLENSHPELYEKYFVKGNEKVLMCYNTDERIQPLFVNTRFGFGNNVQFFGPEIGIAEILGEQEETSYIIKATYSGTCLQTEYVTPKGKKVKYYPRFIKFIKSQLKRLEDQGKNPRVRGVFWMQGESDSFLPESYKYREAEQYFYEYLRHDLNRWIYDHFNFVDAYIFTRGICWVNPEVINDCKQRFCDENEHCYCIKTNGEDETAIKLYLKCESDENQEGEVDLAHYDSRSELLLGLTAGELLLK